MQYVVSISSGPYDNTSSYLAIQIVEALFQAKHNIRQVFFHHNGVNNANSFIYYPHDELNLFNHWKKLYDLYHIQLNVCVTASKRRGLVEDKINMEAPFKTAGLLEYAVAIFESDRLILL